MSTTPPTDQTRGFGLATVGTVVAAVLVLTLFVLYVVRVPSAKKTFDEFGLALPWLTLSVIRVSNWVAEYWWSLAPVLLILGIGHFGLKTKTARTRGGMLRDSNRYESFYENNSSIG